MLYKMLQAQENNPKRGDWVSGVKKFLKDFKINMNFEEIKLVPKTKFKLMIKKAASETAFNDLKEKQRKID